MLTMMMLFMLTTMMPGIEIINDGGDGVVM